MILIDTWISFFQNILIIGIIMIIQNYINDTFEFKRMGYDIFQLLLWTCIALFFADTTFLIMVITKILWRKMQRGTVIDESNDISIFMLLSSLETIIFLLSTYAGQLLIRISVGKTDRILTLYANEITLTGMGIATVLNIIFIFYLYSNKLKINTIEEKLTRLGLEKQFFWFSFGLLGSLEFIITISNLQGITASIQTTLIIIFTGLLCIFYWQFMLFIKTYAIRQEAEDKIARNQQLQDYLVNIEQQYTELRRFKHDYQNILLSLESFAEKGDQQQFKAYYQELLAQRPIQSEIQGAVIAQLDYLKNDPIRGLVIQKFLAAKQAGVTLKFEMTEPIELPSANLLTVIRIIGILLDNAIEQAVQETDKLVSCAFLQSEGLIEITIENTASQVKDIQAFSALGYSTKGAGRGTGLANVQDLIAKQTNLFLETQIENRKLRQTLMITEET